MKGKFDSIISDPRPVIVDFHALWCSPCKIQSPILKEVATELGDSVKTSLRAFYYKMFKTYF